MSAAGGSAALLCFAFGSLFWQAFAVCLVLLMMVVDAVHLDEEQRIDAILAACLVVTVLALGIGIYEFLCGGHFRAPVAASLVPENR